MSNSQTYVGFCRQNLAEHGLEEDDFSDLESLAKDPRFNVVIADCQYRCPRDTKECAGYELFANVVVQGRQPEKVVFKDIAAVPAQVILRANQ